MNFKAFFHQIVNFIVYLATDKTYALPFWLSLAWLVILFSWRKILTGLWRSLNLIQDLTVEKQFLNKIQKPIKILLIVLAVSPFLRVVPGVAGSGLEKIDGFLVSFLTMYVCAQAFDLVVFGWYLHRNKDANIPGVLRFVILAAIYLVFGLVFLEWAFGVNVLPLLATSTVATAVVGFALQDTLKNLFAGLTMSLEKRFKQGDWVMFRLDATNSTTGEVIEIGWRTTKIRTIENNFAVIPNAMFTSNQLTNYSLPAPSCLKSLDFAVRVSSSPEAVLGILESQATKIEGVLTDPQPEAVPVSVNADHVLYRLRFWISDFAKGEQISGNVMKNVLSGLQTINVIPAVGAVTAPIGDAEKGDAPAEASQSAPADKSAETAARAATKAAPATAAKAKPDGNAKDAQTVVEGSTAAKSEMEPVSDNAEPEDSNVVAVQPPRRIKNK